MEFRANPKDNCFPGMSLPTEHQNTASAALESISRNFLDESSSVVERFPLKSLLKKLLNQIWRDSLNFHYVTNSDWVTYLFTLNSENVITKLICAPPYHTYNQRLFLPSEKPHHTSYSPFSKLLFLFFASIFKGMRNCNIRHIF